MKEVWKISVKVGAACVTLNSLAEVEHGQEAGLEKPSCQHLSNWTVTPSEELLSIELLHRAAF